MTKLLDRVQGPTPSDAIRKARLGLWKQRSSRAVNDLVEVSGPIRSRTPTDQETGQHVIQQSDRILWCTQSSLYTRKRQSRQFAAACIGVARPSLVALKDACHPRLQCAFKQNSDACAEVFALLAHSYSCRIRQYAQQILFGFAAARCSCFSGETALRPDNPLSLA